MAKLLMWNLSRLKTPSVSLSGPLPELYLRDIIRLTEETQGVFISGIQIGDCRRFCVANPRFKGFPSVIYNPEILDQYDLIKSEGEGCLSFPGVWVNIPRYKYVEVKYRDGSWKEITATFGSDNPSSEEGLLAKAVQHEIYHMRGICLHERITDPAKRLKVSAFIMKQSIAQNKAKGVPNLVTGPAEIDPKTLPVENNTSPLQFLSDPEISKVAEEVPPSMDSQGTIQ